MSTARVITAGFRGIVGVPTTVEVTVEPGLPCWTILGTGGRGADLAQLERLAAAVPNAGFTWPRQSKVTCTVSEDKALAGTGTDVALALAVLVATGQLAQDAVDGIWFLGELAVSGEILSVRGALPVAQAAVATGARGLVVPIGNLDEARLAGGALQGYTNLNELVFKLRREQVFPSRKPAQRALGADFNEIPGHAGPKRALEIAAAGGHHIILDGPAGAGKTMLARRVPSILPVLTDEQYHTVSAIHSVAGTLPVGVAPTRNAPFRAPHHTTSLGGLLGGGPGPRPGEVSLAHGGVLFLDELPELPRYVMDGLCQVLVDQYILISRASSSVHFPAHFMLIGGALPCPCGFGNEPARCRCSAGDVTRYRGRISGPFRDRIDMRVTVPAITLGGHDVLREESSAVIGARVDAARAMQQARYGVPLSAQSNNTVPAYTLRRQEGVTNDALALLVRLSEQGDLTARESSRATRVARTIADLAQSGAVAVEHIEEALQYVRTGDRS